MCQLNPRVLVCPSPVAESVTVHWEGLASLGVIPSNAKKEEGTGGRKRAANKECTLKPLSWGNWRLILSGNSRNQCRTCYSELSSLKQGSWSAKVPTASSHKQKVASSRHLLDYFSSRAGFSHQREPSDSWK